MNYLYLILNLGSLIIPFLFSFHPKLKFYKLWKSLFISIAITMAIFIFWDVIFTKNGFWGFNQGYHLRLKIFSLPIEEWLFFICIPYACVFTHYSLLIYFPKMLVSRKATQNTTLALAILFVIIAVLNYSKWYTTINFGYAFIFIMIVRKYNLKLLQHYLLTFIIMLAPFFLINGILTGSFIDNEVVWYNNNENLGIRLGTIPIEDTVYAFTLILTNLFLVELINSKIIQVTTDQ